MSQHVNVHEVWAHYLNKVILDYSSDVSKGNSDSYQGTLAKLSLLSANFCVLTFWICYTIVNGLLWGFKLLLELEDWVEQVIWGTKKYSRLTTTIIICNPRAGFIWWGQTIGVFLYIHHDSNRWFEWLAGKREEEHLQHQGSNVCSNRPRFPNCDMGSSLLTASQLLEIQRQAAINHL